MTWLDPLRTALDAAPTPCPVFFRDDDAGWGDAELLALLDVFDRHGVPVDVAVIPAALHPRLVTELRGRQTGTRLRLHQHGSTHDNHELTGRRHEFGPSRDHAAQAADIERGRELLQQAFGAACEPIFTPPWNRCTAVTVDVLVEQGFAVLSRDSTAGRFDRPYLAEVQVGVDWFGHRRGVRWSRPELAERLAAGVSEGGPLGVLLHHAVTEACELAMVDELVGLVARHPGAAPTTIHALASA